MKLQDIKKGILHVQIFVEGRCPKCNSYNKDMIYDYGEKNLKETEKAMDEITYQIYPLVCKKCGIEYNPKSRFLYDVIRDTLITTVDIKYGNILDTKKTEQTERINQAHKNRFVYFKKHEDDFWREYYLYALKDWKKAVNELRKDEIETAYEILGVPNRFNTVAQYRKDVLNRFKSSKEKQMLWKQANNYFIYEHLLDLGIIAWDVTKDNPFFGKNRMRFVTLNFPIDEELEPVRTMHIGRAIQLDKGDNSFLFKRIKYLTKEIEYKSQKINDYFHSIEEQKYVIADLQQKLHTQYQINKQLADKDKTLYNRDPKDIQKIVELKSLVDELLGELKKYKKDEIQEVKIEENIVKQEVQNEEQQENLLEALNNKTVCIFGGYRQEQASIEDYPCKVITHSANKLDPEFYQALKQGDVLVILTEHISHMAMWTIKAYAIANDIPILFEKSINIGIILNRITKKQ